MRGLRKGDLGGLEIYFFGGRPDVSERARERATRVHRQRKEQTESWKPSQQLASLLANL